MKKRWTALIILLILAIVVPTVCSFIGVIDISPADVLGGASREKWVFMSFRLPRVLVGFLAGAGLAVCGMSFQAMFRNPLTTPYTLGVAGGASLGAVVFISLHWTITILGISGISIFAFGGAVLSVLLIHGLSRVRRSFSTTALLLAGVALSFCYSSIILFLQFHSNFHDSFRIVRWMMGGLQVPGMESVFNLLPFVLCGMIFIAFYTNELNLLSTGEELAASRGVDTARTKKVLFLASSIAVGGIVAICGPIGFVGLMAPHMCRMLVGSDHKFLAPASALFGGTFLVFCDTVARMVFGSTEVPVGVVTALIGGPYFLILLLFSNRHRFS